MPTFNFLNLFSNGLKIEGSDKDDLIIGTFGDDEVSAQSGDDLVLGLLGNDTIAGGAGEDYLFGGSGNDRVIGNTGNDSMFGGKGDDMLVWNNGDGSDLMNGGSGDDRVQVNFDTDLVDDDLQNKDVAEFSVTDEGVQFARIEVNDQTERGLFQLDIRETETLETNFGGGDDKAVIVGDVLDEIALKLDGGDGVDTIDLSQSAVAGTVILGRDKLNDTVAENFENVVGSAFDDLIRGTNQSNLLSGGAGEDKLFGHGGDDVLIGNTGNDSMFGGKGDDMLVWNNGDGSDLMHGGRGDDRVQVNFDTDLVDDDLQNKDVAEFSVTDKGVQFARIEVNDQTERGLFQLDIRETETLETNFGGGDDTAVIVGDVLDEIALELDGGDGVDLLDFSQASAAVDVDLEDGTIDTASPGAPTSGAVGFENVTGTVFDDTITGNDQDNVIRGGAGNDVMQGGEGADTFVFFEADTGVDVILDFEFGVDTLAFFTSDPEVTSDNLLENLSQAGDDVELAFNDKVITFEDAQITDFTTDSFMIA